jgi:nicotinate-nucleotide adenylyltransferase
MSVPLTDRPTESIGVLGGTFDPPHLGHLILAEMACDALKLDCVLFVPAADPPHKVRRQMTPIEHRLAMLSAAIADSPRFVISRVDIDRPGPHYTVDMLRIIGKENPGASLYFLLGGDSLRDILTWRDPAGIVAQAMLGVMRRPGVKIDLTDLIAQVPGIDDRIAFIDAPIIGISASDLRDRLRAGESVRYQLPEAVIRYIRENGLYRE